MFVFEIKMNENYVLITGHYNCKNVKRTREIKKCILCNASQFKQIVVFFENWDEVDQNPEYEYLISTSNIILVKVNLRQTYKMFFEYAFNHLCNNFVIVANSDILFDNTLNRIDEIDMRNTVIALTRWQLETTKDTNNWSFYTTLLQTNEMIWSFDSYIFKPSLLNIESDLLDLDILIGISGCDTYLVKKLSVKGIAIKNPVLDIRSYHIDYRNFREKQCITYWTKEDYPDKNEKNVIPTNLNGFDGTHGLKMTTSDDLRFRWNSESFLQKPITAITYCLWGSNKKYYQNIERNVSDALELYPDMTVILIIHEPSVDLEYLKCLDEWPNVKIIKRQEHYGNFLNMAWRFEILDNPHVGSVLPRDLNSLISEREVVAVREWQKSSKRLHVIDGGIVGIKKMPYLRNSYQNIIAKYQSKCNDFEIDQTILRSEIFPTCNAMNDIFTSFNVFQIHAQNLIKECAEETPDANIEIKHD